MRRRRAMKWACTVMAAVIFMAILVSMRWYCAVSYSDDTPAGRQDRAVVLNVGAVMCMWDMNAVWRTPLPAAWGADVRAAKGGPIWLPQRVDRATVYVLVIPLWIPLLLAAVPGGLLWYGDIRRGRQASAHLCKGCGYDRGGLRAGAACPECGKRETEGEEAEAAEKAC